MFFELVEEDETVYNQIPVNTLIEDMEKMEDGFSKNVVFFLGDEGEIETNRLFRNSSELAKFIDKKLDKYDDHPSIYYMGKINRYFRNFKRVNRSEHGRRDDEHINIWGNEGENCDIPRGSACFFKCLNYSFKKEFSKEYFEFIQ